MKQSVPPAISIVICTRNRCALLDRALDQLTRCDQVHTGDWEVIVVDNASNDATPAVAAKHEPSLPLRVVAEPEPGLSKARNRGAQAARGQWLLWLDDDCAVGASYLNAYRRAISQYPEATCLGSGVEPELLGEPAAWLSRGLQHVSDAFAARPSPASDQPIQRHTLPYGANFAVRRSIVLEHPFDTRIGRHPDRPEDGGEELQMLRYALDQGPGWWVAGADVAHRIEPARQSPQYLHRYYRCAGEMAARGQHPTGARRLRLAARSGSRWIWHTFELPLSRMLRRHQRIARNLRERAWHAGYLWQLLRPNVNVDTR